MSAMEWSVLTEYGTLILFAVVFAEQAGLPLPAIPVLLTAGALAGSGQLHLWMVLGSTTLATVLADGLWYTFGRLHGASVLGLLCRIAIEPDACVQRTREFFVKHGGRSLIVAKFIPGLSTLAPPLAGVIGLGLPLFLVYDGLGTVLWIGSSVGAGYLFAEQLEVVLTYVSQAGFLAVSVVVGSVLIYLTWKLVARYRLSLIPRRGIDQIAEKLDSGEPILFVDVRAQGSAEHDPGIPGAWVIPASQMAQRYRELPTDRDVILYCACPHDLASAEASRWLREHGFSRVWPLAGGLGAWRAWQAQEPGSSVTGSAIPASA